MSRGKVMSVYQESTMRDHILLILGVVTVGATLGYMVGGSATPVVAVAVPAIFGLVVTAVGLMQAAQPSKELLEVIKTFGEKADTIPEIIDFRARRRAAPARIGITLIAFSLAYLGSATVGAKIRINNLLAPPQSAASFPWSSSDLKPPTVSAALQWIALQGRLHELGYDEPRVRELYDIQVSEWKRLASLSAPDPSGAPAKPTTPQAPDKFKMEDIYENWWKQSAPKGSPFATQPPQDLIDKLKGAVPPRGTRPDDIKG